MADGRITILNHWYQTFNEFIFYAILPSQCSQIFQLRHIFKGVITYHYVVTFAYIILMRHKYTNVLGFLSV
jgi:hypothetical protein